MHGNQSGGLIRERLLKFGFFERLFRTNHKKQERIEARERLLNEAAHEIRTSITIIKGQAQLAQLLRARGKLNDAAMNRTLDVVADESVQLQRKCDRFLSAFVSKGDRG